MELASMLGGERFSDHPRSVCPVIGAVLRAYNDGLDDERRRDLYGFAAAAVGTRGPRAVRRERLKMCSEFFDVKLARLPAPGGNLYDLAVAVQQAGARATDESHREVLALLHRLMNPAVAEVSSEPLQLTGEWTTSR
ncbi:MAG: hypothetical protein ACJ76V_06155 [Thermoleophilaceae bacterium]